MADSQSTEIIEVTAADFDQLVALLDDPPAPNAALRELLSTGVTQTWCGPKYLRGIHELCDGSCCGLRPDGTVDQEQTERLNRASPAGGNCRVYGEGSEIVRGPIS